MEAQDQVNKPQDAVQPAAGSAAVNAEAGMTARETEAQTSAQESAAVAPAARDPGTVAVQVEKDAAANPAAAPETAAPENVPAAASSNASGGHEAGGDSAAATVAPAAAGSAAQDAAAGAAATAAAAGAATPAAAGTQPQAAAAETVAAAAATGKKSAETAPEGTRFEHVQETLALLCKYFPKAFIASGDARPLKIGIFDDLRTAIAGRPDLSISKVRAALRLYTTRLRYLYCLKEGAMRVDLEGREVEPVNAEHASFAQEKFKEINGRRKAALKNARAKKPREAGRNPAGNKNAPGHGHPRKFPLNGIKATEADLTEGRRVMVVTGGRRYVKASVSQKAEKGSVMVTLLNGTSLAVPIDRILLPQVQQPRQKGPGPSAKTGAAAAKAAPAAAKTGSAAVKAAPAAAKTEAAAAKPEPAAVKTEPATTTPAPAPAKEN